MKTLNILVLSFLIFLSINIYSQTDNNVTHLKANVGHTDVITDFVLSKNNKYLVTCSEDKSIILWDFETAKEIKTIRGHKNNISCIDISSDNTMLATGESGKDDIASFDVKIWDVKTGNEIRTIKPNAGKIKLVKFTDDGKFLFVGGTNKIIYYDLETGSNIKDYTGFKNELLNISISNDKKFISANSKNKIFLWDINKRETIKVIDKGLSNLTSIALDSKGNSVITGSDDNIIRIYNTISGEETNKIASHRYPIFKLAVNNDNKFIASSDSKSQFFKIFDYNTGQELNSIDAHKGRVGIIKINTNNQFVITAGSWDRKVKVWNLNTGELIKTFSGIEKYIYERAYIDSSQYYAVGKYKNQAFINFMARHIKNKNFKDKNGEITCVTLSNNKKLIAYGTSKNHITVLNANTDTVL
ncbi:MAG: WD40 repeat domain-containing protein, partial [Bacteroidales bacterium]|nr:WD40 repeat domain-containing protein [Bacteroidales bacterium]